MKNINQTSQVSQKDQFKFSASFGQRFLYYSNILIHKMNGWMFFLLILTAQYFPLILFKNQLNWTGFNSLEIWLFEFVLLWSHMFLPAFRQKPWFFFTRWKQPLVKFELKCSTGCIAVLIEVSSMTLLSLTSRSPNSLSLLSVLKSEV